MADVFLSYARPDAAVAERVARELAKLSWSVWLDRELPAHRAYSDVIAAELESASAVLVLWSKASVESEWVRSEANRARELHKLVQGRLDDARLPMPFEQIQCAPLARWHGGRANRGWSQVRGSIAALVGGEAAAAVATTPRLAARREILAGGAAAAAVLAGGAIWWTRSDPQPTGEPPKGQQSSGEQPNAQANLLTQKGIDALQNNDVFAADDSGSLANAVALLSGATQADPRSYTAWGSLALGYAGLKRVSPLAQRPGLDMRSRSAAATALKLKPHEPRATAALLLLDPLYRHWGAAERADRAALRDSPPIPLLWFLLSETLGSTGRSKDAAAASIKADRQHFIIPGADRRVVLDLWAAGDLQGADEALRLAINHWPQQPQVWRTRLQYLMFSGRPSDALAVLHNDAERPPGTAASLVKAFDSTAQALAGRGSAATAVASGLDYLRDQPAAVFGVTQACAALGDLDTAFSILDGYYFDRGAWRGVTPAAGDQDRATNSLFLPSMKPAWGDARFARLVTGIGLENYWRQSGTVPDFRINPAA
ncbi:MAG: toll/interleukin-1 receptor domain-containing protein [Sphingomicrobium sp.]